MNPASATASLPSADDQGNATATAANAPTPMTGARWLVQALAAPGGDTLFGNQGGAIMPFYDSLTVAGLRPSLVRHEPVHSLGDHRTTRTHGRDKVCTNAAN